MSAELIDIIKRLASDQVDSERPVQVLFGTVLEEEPNLTIQLEQQKILTKEFLILSQCVTDHKVDMTVDHWTDNASPINTEDADPVSTAKMAVGGKDPSVSAHIHKHSHHHPHNHEHPYKGRKTFLVHQKLLAGEKVILMSVQGGQQYVVLDRLGADNLNVTDNKEEGERPTYK